MSDLQKHSQRTSAARAGFSERTAQRFDADPTPPLNRKAVHGRTVTDPLEDYWEGDVLPLLNKDSALQAVTLLRHLQGLHPLAFPEPAPCPDTGTASGAPWSGGCGSGGR